MAIFHMSFSNISAGKGRSAIAGAAYRSGKKLFDQKEGRSYFYARLVMPESFILTPKNAPEWASDRERLWNEVERKDRRANSRYAKEFNVALPVELSEDEQKELLTKYVQENFVDEGMVAAAFSSFPTQSLLSRVPVFVVRNLHHGHIGRS